MGVLEDGNEPDSAGSIRKYTQHALWFPFFSLASVSMVLLNKFCAHQFRQPYSLLGFQNSVTIILNVIGVSAGIFSVKPFSAGQFRLFLMPTFLFVAMLVTSLYGLPYVSVATTVMFRAVSTCLVAVGDYFLFGKRFSMDEVACIAVVVIGAQIYAFNDLSFHITGYSWMFANTGLFVVSQLYEKWAIVKVDQSAVGISCIQNLLSLPIIIVASVLMAETPIEGLKKTDGYTQAAIVATGFAGCALSICYMSLSKFASATAISLGGNFNKLLSIVIGAAVFSNPLSALQVLGLAISMVATIAIAQQGQLPACLGGGGITRGRRFTAAVLGSMLMCTAAFPLFSDPGAVGAGYSGDGTLRSRVSSRVSSVLRKMRGAGGVIVPGGGNITAGDLLRADALVDKIHKNNDKIRELSKAVNDATEELHQIMAAPRTAVGSELPQDLEASTQLERVD